MYHLAVVSTLSTSSFCAPFDINSVLILPPYLFWGLFLRKATYKSNAIKSTTKGQKIYYRLIGIITSLFCLWLIYAGGLTLFMLCSIFFVPGIYVFYAARKENTSAGEKIFKPYEKWIAVALIFFALVSIVLIAMGKAAF